MKRVLMVQPSLNPPGGGNGVAAWMIEGLKTENRLTLLAWEPPRLEAINQFYGTSLHPDDFDLILLPRLASAIARWMPTPMALAKDNYLLARCRRLAPRFDLVISASQEAADKIMLVLESAGRQRQLRNYLARRAAQFSADHFVIRLRELVDGFKAI